jgi:8-oxo-dGTP diphosphatase
VRFCSACGERLPERPPVVCPACATEHFRNAKPCAGALVVRDGRLLLLRRDNEPWRERWDIPGGFCDGEEHPMDTAVREAEEETGIEVEITGFLGMWLDRYPNPVDPDQPVVTLNAYYHALTVDDAEGRPEPGEVIELGWFAPDEFPPEIAFPDHATAVLAAWREAWTEGRTVTPLPDRRDQHR